MPRQQRSEVTRIVDFFTYGDAAEVKVAYDLVKDIIRARFALPKVIRRKRRTAPAPQAQRRTRRTNAPAQAGTQSTQEVAQNHA